MPSGAIEYWSTHRVTVEGVTYRARVLGHNLFEAKLSSDDGADGSSRIALTLANADSYFSELEAATGFRGAQLKVRFVFFDLREGAPSCEARVLFRELQRSPDEITDATLRITFANRLSLQRVTMPSIRIQKRCPWVFPGTEAERIDAVDGGAKGRFSRVYPCGYSAGVPGGCGNSDSSGRPFAACRDQSRVCRAGHVRQGRDRRGDPAIRRHRVCSVHHSCRSLWRKEAACLGGPVRTTRSTTILFRWFMGPRGTRRP